MPVQRWVWAGAVACFASLGVQGFAAAQAPPQLDLVADQAAEAATETGRYWIGVHVESADEVLRSQLRLTDGALVIREVVPDAPAAKAGLAEHDVLLRYEDTPLREVQDLIAVVQQSEGKEATVHFVRGGEEQTVTLTPAERKVRIRYVTEPLALDELYVARAAQPFVIRWDQPSDLPEGMKVVVTKEGQSPAEIVVTQGDKTWKATEDSLENLPEEVRQYVTRLLARPMGRVYRFATEHRNQIVAPITIPAPPMIPQRVWTVKTEQSPAEDKLDEILRRLEAVEKELKEARK